MPAFATPAAALQTLVPPLYAQGESAYTAWLNWAAEQIATQAQGWGNQYNAAVALLAGHNWYRLTGGTAGSLTDGDAQVSGAVASRGGGDLSEGYAALGSGVVVSLETAELNTTRPGAAFVRLRQSCSAFGARLVRV